MRISIGHRLFAAVLLAILAVAATGIWLMRSNVLGSFGEYAARIELDRLDELSRSLARQYSTSKDWGFLPHYAVARREFVVNELRRLEMARLAVPQVPLAPSAPGPHAAPVPPREPAVLADGPVPPPPPPPAAPVLPPLPAPPVVVAATPAPGVAPLELRVTLLSASGHYLAGREDSRGPSARRELVVAGQTVGYLAVARALRPSDAMALAFLDQLKQSLAAIVAISVALSALAATLLARHFRQPVLRLAEGTRALAAGRYDTRLDIDRSDELGELADNFNRLAEKLESAERMRRDWVADTSHELRTPVSVLRAQIEAMIDGVRPASPENLAVLERQVMSLNRLVDELYVLARLDVGELEYRMAPVDAWALFTAEARAFTDKLQAAGLALSLGDAPATSIVQGDAGRLRQVVDNLLENSVRYTASGGEVRATASVDAGRVTLLLDDSAPGVPDEALSRLTERFYRVDASRSRKGGGSGLGLALVERIVQAHGGELAFSHSPLGGLRVAVSLPLAAQVKA